MRTPMFLKGVTKMSAKTSLDTKKDSNVAKFAWACPRAFEEKFFELRIKNISPKI